MAGAGWQGCRAPLLAILVVGASPFLAAAQNRAWSVVGQSGGPSQGIAVQGSLACAGLGMRLVVLDVSDPSSLREVGAAGPFAGFVEDVALSGSLAWVAAGTAGLRVVDVSSAAAPFERGAWDSKGYAHGVAVAATTAFVADGPDGLRVVDVTNPAQPFELGSAYSMNYVFDVAVQGRYAYLAAGGAGLLIADVSDPRHPVEVGSLFTGGYAWGVAVAGDRVYLADGWDGVKAIDVADAARPALAGSLATPGWAFGVTVAGTTVSVADAFGGLRVVDFTDPAHPVETGFWRAAGGHAGSVAVAGNTAFVVDRNHGVRAVSLGPGPALSQTGAFDPMSYADGVTVSGTRAYVAEANAGLFVIDLADATHPRQIGHARVDGNSKDVVVRGTVAYLTTKGAGSAGLHVFDITDPGHPLRVEWHVLSSGQPKGMDLAGDHLYVAVENGLEIFNVSDPRHPVRAAFLPTKGGLETLVGVTVAGTLAYVSLERGGLAVVDIANPANPVRRGSFTPGSAYLIRNMAVAGTRAYVADTGFGLRVLDVSDPDHLREVASLRTAGPQSVVLWGGFAVLSCGDLGLVVVDVSDPARPVLAGSFPTPGYTRGTAVDGNRFVLADGPNGILILGWSPDASRGFEAIPETAAIGLAPAGVRRPVTVFRPGEGTQASANAVRPQAAPASCLVSSVSDSGEGTLRQCLQNAGEGTTITFDPAVFPPGAPASIRLVTGLPGVRGGVTIDGSDAGVILDGSGAVHAPGTVVFGLFIASNGNTVRGLQIVGFPGNGIQISGDGNVIGGDRSVGRGPVGQGNVVSGNAHAGIMITGDGGTASGNVVIGNFVGTDASGTRPMGNGLDGVWVQRATNNRVGGLDAREGNVVSANGWSGINLSGESTENLIAGNFVGTDVTGTQALGNNASGVMIGLAAFGNVLRGNLSSGNRGSGVGIDDQGSSYNEIVGNRIGTDASGTRAVPNLQHGVWINETLSAFNRIGGTRPEDRNIVSGNLGDGCAVLSSGNVILGNFIGTDITGRLPLGNAGSGVSMVRSPNMLGGATWREANVIAASGLLGIAAWGTYSTVIGNFVGIDADREVPLGNAFRGISAGGRQGVLQGNVIAHTARSAQQAGGSGVAFSADFECTVRRNSIHDNAGSGIETASVPPPVVTGVTATAVTGRACPGCEVEIFSDSEDEGRLFEGSTVADGSGAFLFAKSAGSLSGPKVTATATDGGGRTSPFSSSVARPPKPPRRRGARH